MDPLQPHGDPDPRAAPARRRPLTGLATQLVLFVFAASLIAAAAVSWVSIQSTDRALRGMVGRLYPLSAGHAAARIRPWIEGIRLHLEHLHQSESPPAADSRFDGLAAYDAEGRRLDRWGEVPEAAAQALASPSRLAALRLADGRWALAIAPRSRAGPRQHVAVAALSRLEPLLAAELPAETSLLALTDADGLILLHAGALGRVPRPERIDLDSLHARSTLREARVAGHRVVGATQPIDLLGWHVAVLVPYEAAYGAVTPVLERVFLIDAGIVLVLSLLTYAVTGRFLRPIERLSEATRRLARGEPAAEVEETGAQDEIGLLTRAFNDMVRQQREQRREIEQANRNLLEQNARLEQANEVLSQLSITDGLTKLHNHRFFQDHLSREIRRVAHMQEPLSILVIDLDDFKRLNDQLGHSAGDEILVRVAQILNEGIRNYDLCARYGGEEFVVLTPATDVLAAYELAEQLRTAIAESSFIVDDSMRPLRATASIGVAVYTGDRKQFFQKADQALYRAKARGKNCTVVHEDDWPDELGPPPSI